MTYRLDFFPESYIALNQELSNHPELCRLLANHPPQEFEIRLAEIATYCGVVLDGDYYPDDLEKLADILWTKLREKSSLIILS
jgi:hypothetical protein